MLAEILATGNEVLTGTIVDSNSAFIAQRLEEAGIEVKRHTCVGDDISDISAALKESSARADVVLVTGGLGPTGDDLTAEAVARAAGGGLQKDEAAYASLKRFFNDRGMTMRETDPKQAMLPDNAVCIPNRVGSAPGFFLDIGSCRVYVMPGVPFEMEIMLVESVIPDIGTRLADGPTFAAAKTISVFGLPESEVGRLMNGLSLHFPEIRYGIRVSFPETFVKVSIRHADKNAARSLVDKAAEWTKQTIGDFAFSIQGLSLPAEVGRLMTERKETVAVAESCTGGLVGNLLTNNPGSSGYFLLSAVTYANAAKTAVLNIPEKTISENGAVSEAVVRSMAVNVCRLAGATYGLATSGIAGPDGGTPQKPIGTVWIGLASPRGVTARKLTLSFQNRSMNKRVFAFAALEMLRRQLISKPEEKNHG